MLKNASKYQENGLKVHKLSLEDPLLRPRKTKSAKSCSNHLVRPSVRPSVCLSLRLSVRHDFVSAQ